MRRWIIDRPLVRFVFAAAAVAGLSACHTYTAVDVPAIGSTVRVQVPVTSALTGPNAAPRTEAVEGLVVAAGDTLALAMTTRRELGAYREMVQYDTLKLGASQASLIEVREFSPTRSIVLGSLIAVGVGSAAVYAFNSAGGGGDPFNPGDQGPVTSIVVDRSIISSLIGLIIR